MVVVIARGGSRDRFIRYCGKTLLLIQANRCPPQRRKLLADQRIDDERRVGKHWR